MRLHGSVAVLTCLALSVPAMTMMPGANAAPQDDGVTLHQRSVIVDSDGTQHIRYDRQYHGLRIIGGDLVVHRSAQGRELSRTVNTREQIAPRGSDDPLVTRRTSLSEAQAMARATSKAAPGSEKRQAEKVVFNGKNGPVMAYDVLVTGIRADQTPVKAHTIVDGTTGAVLAHWDVVRHGTGNGIHDGKVDIATTKSGKKFVMKDKLGNAALDMKGQEWGDGVLFSSTKDVWGDGTQKNRASAAVDALFGAQKTYDYYQNIHKRAGIWDNGKGAVSRVHYGQSYDNAFWDGEQMTYGDGENDALPLTSLDVAAHEMTHGVTQNTANLGLGPEAGGLNEATSDIFAAAVEWYANLPNNPPNYLMGEKLIPGGAIRYMDQPSKDKASPDCYNDQVGSMDEHYAAGPLNHWFYLMAEGSGAKTLNGFSYNSPTCNNKKIKGVGRATAEKIWFRALTVYLTSGAGYAQARDGAIHAAKDLYGASSKQCRVTTAAFDAISVPKGSQTCE
ncbi:M4 family metallopeptidase [Austwickia sp. TVS 96-490-7B]|uniref:M4 family metallopeptidase n=1 Tax=Austwickia sp. TVS 96-490-7B TaxID=2830843 RepID=UPI002106376E|nr:M4 family metallopeptidase [Austwickia sp. TVS 96-490-7B]